MYMDMIGILKHTISKLKEIVTQSWLSPNSGANNESGFSARAAGYLSEYGTFRQMGYVAYYWTSTEINSNAWTRLLDKDGTYSSRNKSKKFMDFLYAVLRIEDCQLFNPQTSPSIYGR